LSFHIGMHSMKRQPDEMVLSDTMKYQRSDSCSLKSVFIAAKQANAVMDETSHSEPRIRFVFSYRYDKMRKPLTETL